MADREGQTETLTFRPHRRQFLVDEFPVIMMTVLLAVIPGIDTIPAVLQKPAMVVTLVLLLFLLVRYLQMRATRYDITTEQIIYKRGLVNIRRDYIELYRVVTFDERRNALQLLLGLKNVTIFSGDRSIPELTMKGISSHADIIDHMRHSVELNKRRRGIYEITNR